MGQEITQAHFSNEEKKRFIHRLNKETHLFKQQLASGEFSSQPPMGGFEIEAWLVNDNLRPAPLNQAFFELFNNPLATPELAKFNIELNNTPHRLEGSVFKRFEAEMNSVFSDADRVAKKLDTNVLLTGILPTLRPDDCCVENMSKMKRYRALNEIILNARESKPIRLDIKGRDHLQLTHNSVMMEAATTSFQIHLQTPWKQAHHYYNASIIASAPLMAISGNSPFLFGEQLWHETRIPLFEQSVDTGNGLQRVSFGTGYARASISECFDENLHAYPVLLPMLFEDDVKAFSHLRLHNGVIWRWNRPLVGFDADGTPHIRIEHRILPAGPTMVDMMANAAFFYGLTQSLMEQLADDETNNIDKKLPFHQAKNNFYQAAQNGLNATINWNNKSYAGSTLQGTITEECLPQAAEGLRHLDIDETSISHYLGIIADRVASGQTGAVWQINHLQQLNNHSQETTPQLMQQLTEHYLHHQHDGQPVHTWTL